MLFFHLLCRQWICVWSSFLIVLLVWSQLCAIGSLLLEDIARYGIWFEWFCSIIFSTHLSELNFYDMKWLWLLLLHWILDYVELNMKTSQGFNVKVLKIQYIKLKLGHSSIPASYTDTDLAMDMSKIRICKKLCISSLNSCYSYVLQWHEIISNAFLVYPFSNSFIPYNYLFCLLFQAGELFLSVNMVKEGLDMMMLGEQWDKARHIAKDIAPRWGNKVHRRQLQYIHGKPWSFTQVYADPLHSYEQYVEDAYIDFLKEKNRPTEACCHLNCMHFLTFSEQLCTGCIYWHTIFYLCTSVSYMEDGGGGSWRCSQDVRGHQGLGQVSGAGQQTGIHVCTVLIHTHKVYVYTSVQCCDWRIGFSTCTVWYSIPAVTWQFSYVWLWCDIPACTVFACSLLCSLLAHCFFLPSPQGSDVMAKYVALYAADLIKSNDPISALKLYTVHGAPAVPQNFNLYRRLCMEVFNLTDDAVTGYFVYANLRDVLLNLVSCLARATVATLFPSLLHLCTIVQCMYCLYSLIVNTRSMVTGNWRLWCYSPVHFSVLFGSTNVANHNNISNNIP